MERFALNQGHKNLETFSENIIFDQFLSIFREIVLSINTFQ